MLITVVERIIKRRARPGVLSMCPICKVNVRQSAGMRCGPCRAEQSRDYRRVENAKTNAASKRWGDSNKEKTIAIRAVNHMIRSKRWTRQPCEICGTTATIDAHHDDYSRPLDVRWLCRQHHKQRHAEIDENGTTARKEAILSVVKCSEESVTIWQMKEVLGLKYKIIDRHLTMLVNEGRLVRAKRRPAPSLYSLPAT